MKGKEFCDRYRREFNKECDKRNKSESNDHIYDRILQRLNALFKDEVREFVWGQPLSPDFKTHHLYQFGKVDPDFVEKFDALIDESDKKLEAMYEKRDKLIDDIEKKKSGKKMPEKEELLLQATKKRIETLVEKIHGTEEIEAYDGLRNKASQGIGMFDTVTEKECELYFLLNYAIPGQKGIFGKLNSEYQWEIIPLEDRKRILSVLKEFSDNPKWDFVDDVYECIELKLLHPEYYRFLLGKKKIYDFCSNIDVYFKNLENDTVRGLLSKITALGFEIRNFENEFYSAEQNGDEASEDINNYIDGV